MSNITVEPVLFIYMLAVWLQFPTLQGLLFHKLCLREFNDSVFCQSDIDNGSYVADENRIHAETSHWMFYCTLCLTLPSLVTAPYFGSWSDRVSRKIPLVIPPIGAILGCVSYIVSSVYMHLPVGLILMGPLLNGLSGGFITTILAVFSYVGAASPKENRNVRVSVLESMSFLGGTVGLGVSGLLLGFYGFPTLFGVLMCCHLCIVAYVLLFVPSLPCEAAADRSGNYCAFLFSPRHIVEYVKCVFKPRGAGVRRNLLTVILALFLVFLCFAGG